MYHLSSSSPGLRGYLSTSGWSTNRRLSMMRTRCQHTCTLSHTHTLINFRPIHEQAGVHEAHTVLTHLGNSILDRGNVMNNRFFFLKFFYSIFLPTHHGDSILDRGNVMTCSHIACVLIQNVFSLPWWQYSRQRPRDEDRLLRQSVATGPTNVVPMV
jgi:hypothetical protein